MAGRGDDVEAEALQVVVGVGGRGQLVLAGVAGAGVDVADRERAAPPRRGQGDRRGGALEVVEQDEHAQRSTQA